MSTSFGHDMLQWTGMEMKSVWRMKLYRCQCFWTNSKLIHEQPWLNRMFVSLNMFNQLSTESNNYLLQARIESYHHKLLMEAAFPWLPLLEDDKFDFLQGLNTMLCPEEGDAIAPPNIKLPWC